MFREIFERYQTGIPDFPPLRRPRVGAAIREIRTNRGQRQMDFAGMVKINPSTFKSFENDHQKATTVENLDRCAAALKTTTEDLILLGREYDPANFFVMKRPEDIPEIKGLRKRKHVPEDWFQTVRFTMKDFEVAPLSPPVNARKDFFICRLGLPPKKRIENLDLGAHNPVVTYIADGFNLEVAYAGKNHKLTSGQAFMLDGYFKHTIVNHDEDHAAVIYLVTKIPKTVPGRNAKREPRQEALPMNIAQGVDAIRKYGSDRSQKPLSLRHLAALTDTLNERQINEIIRLKQGSSVVYWEKIEDLLSAVDLSMEDFLLWARGLNSAPFSVAGAKTRAWVEFPNCGLKIYSCTPPGVDNFFFCGEVFMEGAGQAVREIWERKDKAMIALYVEEGELQIFAGKRKKAYHLLKGDSAYFDGNLGYALRNVSKTQTRLFMATHKAIQV